MTVTERPAHVQIQSTVSALLAGLLPVLPFVPKKTTLPVLQYAILSAGEGGGRVEATDLELGYCGAIEVGGDGALLVPAHALVSLLKNCDPSETVTLTQAPTGAVRVRVGRDARYTLPSQGVDQFPLRRQGGEDALRVDVAASVVAGAMRGVLCAMPEDEIRFSIAGIDLRGHGTAVEATATDGFVLAHLVVDSVRPVPDFTVLLPGPEVPKILGWLEHRPTAIVTLGIEPACVTLTDTDTTITARLTEATFVEWHQLVPADVGRCFPVERAALLQCVKRGYALKDNPRTCTTRLTSQEGALLIDTLNNDEVIAQEIVPCPGAAPGAFILFRTIQFLGVLQTIAPQEATVRLGIRKPVEACVVYGEDREAHFALIIPMRDSRPGAWAPDEEEVREAAYAVVS
jgi:DNA polymerase III subunit beta